MKRVAVAVAAFVAMTSAALAGPVCYLEGSAGKNVTATRIAEQIDGAVSVTADGAQIGIGAGCDVDIGRTTVGLLARYDLTDVSGSISDAKIGADNMWMLAARGGFRINPSTLVYGLAGIAGTKLNYGDVKFEPTGLVYGAGIETNVGLENLTVGIEWDHVAWSQATDMDTRLRPDTDIIRLTLKVRVDLFK